MASLQLGHGVETLPSVEDQGQTHHGAATTRARLRQCRWPWPRRTPRRASSQLMTSQWKSTSMAINQYSHDFALDTRVHHTFCADLWPCPTCMPLTFRSRTAMVMTHARVTRSSDAADDALSQSKPRELLYNRHGTGSLGQRVNGSFESSFMVFVFLLCACSRVVAMWKINSLSCPGHRVTGLSFWPGVRPEFFRFSKKMPKMQNVHLKCWNDKGHCQVSVVGLKSLDVSPCDELLLLPMIIKNSLAWEYFFTHKSTFWVHYRTGSLGHWVVGSQNVTQFNLCCTCC